MNRARRCRHPNLVVKEIGIHAIVWQRDDGSLQVLTTTSGDLTGEIRLQCPDCDLDRSYGAHARRPQWVKVLEAEIYERETSERSASNEGESNEL